MVLELAAGLAGAAVCAAAGTASSKAAARPKQRPKRLEITRAPPQRTVSSSGRIGCPAEQMKALLPARSQPFEVGGDRLSKPAAAAGDPGGPPLCSAPFARSPRCERIGDRLATHKSAEKRARQDAKRHARNRAVKSETKTIVKALRAELDAGAANVEGKLRAAESALRKAASRGVIPKRRASRLVSRLAKRANKAKR